MNKKHFLRRVLSLFCVAALLLSSGILPSRTVYAENNGDSPYREVTFSDFGIFDQTVPSGGVQRKGALSDATNLDGVAFTGMMKLDPVQHILHSFRIGGKDGDDNAQWSGVGLRTEGTNQLLLYYYTGVNTGKGDIAKFPIADYGITYDASNGYSEFKLRMTFDYIDGTNNIQLKVWFNDKLAYDGVLTDAQNYFGNRLHLWTMDKPMSVASVTDSEEEPPAAYREVTFSDFGLSDQIVTSQNGGTLPNAENLDGVAFTGKLQMGVVANMYHSFRLGGKGGEGATDHTLWSGVGVRTASQSTLSFYYYTAVATGKGEIASIPIADYGITYDAATGFSEFTLRMLFDFVEDTNDIKLTVFVNGQLACKGVLQDAQDYFGNQLHLWANGQPITIASAEPPVLPEQPENPEEPPVTTYREVTFSDFGISDQTVAGDNQIRKSLPDAQNLDGVAFTGYMQLQLQADMRYSFRIGGKGADNAPDNEQWRGVGLWPEARTHLSFYYYTAVMTGKGPIAQLPIADYGITYDAATNTYSEFKLRMTFDNIEGTSDMKLVIYLNDKLAVDTVLNEGQLYLGNRLHIWTNGGKTMTVKSVSEDTGGDGGTDEEEEPVTYREVTFSDFGLDDQIITNNGQASGELSDAENLDGVAFTGFLQMGLMADGLHSFRIGGKTGTDDTAWSGVGLWTEAPTQLAIYYYTCVTLQGMGDIVKIPIADYGITYDADTGYSEFKLRITFDYVDGTNDIKVTISVNDKLAYDGILNDAQDHFGNQMRLWAHGGKDITIKSVSEGTGGDEEEEPVTYREVTFSDFGIADQTVAAGSQKSGALSNAENLDGVAFTGFLQMELKQFVYHSFRIGGKAGSESDNWSGVGVYTESANALVVHYYTGVTGGSNICKIPIADYGITYDEATGFSEIKLRITFNYVEDSTDVKITVAVNDIEAYQGILTGAQNVLGNQLRLWAFGDKTITVKSVEKENEDDDGMDEEEDTTTYREVTFYDFGILDQKIPANNQLGGALTDVENLDGIAFTGRLQLSLKQHTLYSFRLGGKPGDDNTLWTGVGMYTESASALAIHYYTGVFGGNPICKIPIADYGITYDAATGFSELKLRIAFHYIEDTEDVRITVWVNDIQAYKGVLAGAQNTLGNQLRMWAFDNTPISLRSYPDGVCPEEKIDPAPVITEEFKQISFATFLFEEGTYGTEESPLNGHCRENSLDKVVFSDTLHFPEGGDVQWRFGGLDSIWTGLMFTTSGNTLKLSNTVNGEWLPIVFEPEVAGCDLVGKDVKITLSFEYVDSDDDGEKDDVKLGVWFNDKAYADRCYYLIGEAPALGGHTMFYSPSGKHGVTIQPYYPSLDFTIFGFTSKWAVELGLKKG